MRDSISSSFWLTYESADFLIRPAMPPKRPDSSMSSLRDAEGGGAVEVTVGEEAVPDVGDGRYWYSVGPSSSPTILATIDAIIDVTHPEVPQESSALYDLPNVFLTPHIAGAIGNERELLGEYVVEEIERFVQGHPLRSAITPAALETMA